MRDTRRRYPQSTKRSLFFFWVSHNNHRQTRRSFNSAAQKQNGGRDRSLCRGHSNTPGELIDGWSLECRRYISPVFFFWAPSQASLLAEGCIHLSGLERVVRSWKGREIVNSRADLVGSVKRNLASGFRWNDDLKKKRAKGFNKTDPRRNKKKE